MDQVQKLEISQHTAFLAVSWSLYWNLFTAEHVKNVMTILMWMWFWVIPPSQLAKNQDDNDDSRDPSQRDWATKNFNQRHFDPGWGESSESANGYLVVFWWVQEGGLPFFADAQGDSLLTIKREKPPVPHWLTPMSTQRCPKFSEFNTPQEKFPHIFHALPASIGGFHMDSPRLFLLSNMAVTLSTGSHEL